MTLTISTVAFGRKSREKESSPKVPIVAVSNLKVDSTNESVQKKIAELTDKVRDAVASSTTTCKVINTKQMRSFMKKHGKAVAACYDDCDVELGLLIGADFVISGRLAPTASSVVTTLEIRDTRTRNVILSKKIEGNNYFALEGSLLSAIRKFVKPLNNVVYQAVDDEVVRDKPEQAAPQPASLDPFAPAATPAADAPTAANPESEYLAPTVETRQAPPSKLALKWQEYKEEPPFLKDEDLGFKKAQAGVFGLGINVGYPFNVARAKQLTSLYTPVFHAGVQLLARVHHMLEIAVVGELDYLTGRVAADHRFGSPGLNNCIDPDDYDERNLRQCYANADAESITFDYDPDDPSNNFYRNNTYVAGSYLSIGVRPTIRLVFPIGIVDTFIGAGLGINYVKTSGYWETHAAGQQFIRQGSTETVPVSENLVYNVSVASVGFYGVFEAAAVFRVLDKRFGFGPYIEYKLPTMWKKGVDVDVQLDNLQGTDSTMPNGDYSAFGRANDDPMTREDESAPKKEEIAQSPFGHLEMLNLLTIGLTADWRF